MFYQKLVALCAKNNISVSKMCKDIGLVPSASARWKQGSVPNMTTLFKIADYFSIEPEYFLAYCLVLVVDCAHPHIVPFSFHAISSL